jgi:hypothetical protein
MHPLDIARVTFPNALTRVKIRGWFGFDQPLVKVKLPPHLSLEWQ